MKTAALVLASLAFFSPHAFAEKLKEDAPQDHYEAAMRFSTFKPCEGKTALCAPQILAEGLIEFGTAAQLERFLKTKTAQVDPLPASPKISFDSAGGDLAGALQLGRYIRAHKLNTNLELDYTRASVEQQDRSEKFVANARCNAACVIAFAGGVERTVDVEAKMGMKAFPRNAKPVAGVPTPGELSMYLRDMGVRSELLNVAVLALPGTMVWFSDSQLAFARLDNSQPYSSPWALADSGVGTPVASVRQEISNARTLSLMLGYHEGKFMLISSTELSRTLMEDIRVQQFPVGQQPTLSLRTDKRTINVQASRAWSRNDNGEMAIFVAVGSLSEDEANSLAAAQTLRLDDGFSTALADLSGATDLSVENLKPTVGLLLRSK